MDISDLVQILTIVAWLFIAGLVLRNIHKEKHDD